MRVLQTSKFTHLTYPTVRGDVVMSFDTTDPLVATFEFHVPDTEYAPAYTTTWTFSRDMLAEGCALSEGVGDGEVRFWKCQDEEHDMLIVALDTAEQGHCSVEIPRQSVLFFLETCDAQVRRGSKAEDMVLAEQVELLLGALFCG